MLISPPDHPPTKQTHGTINMRTSNNLPNLALALGICSIASLTACTTQTPASVGNVAMQKKYQATAFYRMQLGDFEITALSDGTVKLPLDRMISGVATDEVRTLLAAGFEALPTETSINAFLVHTGSKLLLVDAGAGTLFGQNGGQLLQNLKMAGYGPEEIDAVLLTHLHGDHSGGLTVDGKRVFPNAVVYLDKADRDYRFDEEAEKRAPASQKNMFPQSRASLAPYEAARKVVLFQGATELFPGVKTLAAHGHTPGHTLYSVESKGQQITFFGDLVHAASIQFPRPQATISFDADQHEAASDRLTMFRTLSANRSLVGAAHISFPGLGYVVEVKKGEYRWQPRPYSR